MSQSNWCNTDNWFTDQKFTQQSPKIPVDTIDDADIQAHDYTYSIIDSTCFGKMPFLKCNNLNIVVATGNVMGGGGLTFSCANLSANNVTIGLQNITCQHWDNTEFCNWDISTLKTLPNHKTTYLNKLVFNNLNSGSLDHTVINQCYIKSNTLELDHCDIEGTDDIRTFMSCSSGSVINTKTNATKDKVFWEGDFWVSGETIESTTIRGSGKGTFDFTRSMNYAAIDGDTKFGNAAKNYGKLYGNPIFSGGSHNFGIIVGDCIFSGDNSCNYGTISGASVFISGALNRGTITRSSIFYSGTSNYGNLKDSSLFYYANNHGILNNGSKFICSDNNGPITSGDVIFISGTNRTTLTTSGNISFNSGCQNFGNLPSPSAQVSFDFYSVNTQGTIDSSGFVTFGTGCVNLAQIKNGLFSSTAQNNGTILMNSIFKDFACNYETISTGLFYDSSVNSGTINSLGTFYNSSINDKGSIIKQTGIFYDLSINSGSIDYGFFHDNSINSSGSDVKILKSGMFYNSSKNYGYVASVLFYDNTSNNSGAVVGTGVFFSNSLNASGAIVRKLAYFSGNSINYGDKFFGENFDCTFSENASNNGYIGNNLMVVFSGYASNGNYVKNAQFRDFAQNDTMGTGYNLSFYSGSFNKGYIDRSGSFYDRSMNLNEGVIVDAVFYNLSTNGSSMRRPLVSGYGFLTSGDRKLLITDKAKNQGLLDNVDATFTISGINESPITWNFNKLLIFTSSGIYNTGTTPYSFVPTGAFLLSYSGANIPKLSFSGYSINQADIIGYKTVSFNENAKNYGSISTYPPVPKDSDCVSFSGGYNYGPIQNACNFSYSSVHYGTIFFAKFDNSTNSGTVADSGLFINSVNYGNVNVGSFISGINSGTVNIGIFNFSDNYERVNIAYFPVSGTNTVSGIISNSGSFGSKSENKSIITSPILTFSYDAKNNGRVMEAYFSGTAINDSSGSIIGNGDFFGSSSNIGNQVFTLNFHELSTNQSNSTGNFKFYDTSKNSGILTGKTIFLNNSETNGQCFGDVSLYDSTTNKGLLSGTILLQGSGSNPPTNRALIIGNGNVLLVLAENFGTINGNSLFTSGINKGYIEKGSFFFDSSNAANGTVSGECKFYNSSVNLGTASTYAFFYNSGYNLGTVSTGIFNNESNNNGTTNIGLFYNNAKNSAIVNSGEFHDSSYNDFSGHDISIAFLYDDSVNYGSINNAYFENNSINTGTVSLGTFNNGAKNIGTIEGNGIFNNSTNRGSIKGYATFNSSNCTAGTIDNDALFTNSSFCSNTTINGSATFNSGSCYDKNTTTIRGNITKPENCNP